MRRRDAATPAFTHRSAWSAIDIDGVSYPHGVANGAYTMPFNLSGHPVVVIPKRIEFCYTPKYGSWINIAENELSALTRQCVNGRRFETINKLQDEIAAYQPTATILSEALTGE